MGESGANIFSMKGKTALITGATGYLGSAMATILAEAGAHVLVNSRSVQACSEKVKELSGLGLSAETAIFDVTDEASVKEFSSSISARPINVLINNAYHGSSGTLSLTNELEFTNSYDIVMVAANRLFRSLLPNFRLAVRCSSDASVINIASMYALVSPDQRIYDDAASVNPAFYGAAKAALLQWTRYAACEFGKESIRINSISPGAFPSPRAQESSPDLMEKLCVKTPLGRIGCKEEIKGPALFLASSASSYVNGSNLVVDGGWSSW